MSKGKRSLALLLSAILTLSILAGCSGTAAQSGATNSVSTQTTNSSNTTTAVKLEGDISFSQSGGLYEQAFELALSTDVSGGIVRYTLDGSDPTADSEQYSSAITIADRTDEENNLSAISTGNAGGGPGGGRGGPGQNSASSTPTENVFKGTVVKAAVFSASGEQLSEICTQSYFVSEDIFSRYGDLPIVSISTDAANFFGDSSGIYVNYNQSGADWERAVYFEMFDSDGTEVVAQNMGVRINGGTTRTLAQKALRFYANSDYDTENTSIEYGIFDGLTTSYSDDLLTSFKRIILRSSGNDNSGTLFRDALMQSLVSDLNVDTQAAQPCIAFVNGEFWGIYNIRERYDDQYFTAHYDIDKDNVAILEISRDSGSTPEINEGDETDLAFYNEMYSFFESNSLRDDANYQKAQEYIDVDNFIDYYITNIYSGNEDWPGNNNIFWRYKTANGGYDDTEVWYEDGRFRWMIKDMDWGFGLQVQVTSDTLAFALGQTSTQGNQGRGGGMGFNADYSTLFFRRLIENEDFKARFVNRFCDVMNTNYNTDTVVAAINAYADSIAPAISEQVARYPSSAGGSVSNWEANVQTMVSFAQQRTGYVQGFLASQFSLGDVVTVTLQADSSAGCIRINDTDITTGTRGVTDASNWSGEYFAGTTQTFTAVPADGYSFVKFIVTDIATGTVKEYTANSISIALGSKGASVQAVFA